MGRTRRPETRRGGRPIDLEELQRALAEADPTAVLVPPRIIRRVIKEEHGLFFRAGRYARQTSYIVPRRTLEAIVDGHEIGRTPPGGRPEIVLLIARPEPADLEEKSRAALLTQFWRRLFRARVQAEIQFRLDARMLDDRALSARIKAIGRAEFEEIRLVLRQDRLIIPPCGNGTTYRAFAAAFLDLTRFAPGLREVMFPAIEDPRAVEIVLGFDVDAEALFHATRIPGAPDPGTDLRESRRIAEPGVLPREPSRSTFDEGASARVHDRGGSENHRVARWRRLADAAAERGNLVRAAILHTRAARLAGPHDGEADRTAARAALKQLAVRLQKAHCLRRGEAERWAEALTPLLRPDAWNPETRLLYDLQKVCIDNEREVYRLDPIGWAFTFGCRPLKRPLPNLREVSIARHVRGAFRRLPTVRLTHDERARLHDLLEPAVHRAEEMLREQYRPLIDGCLAAHWAQPANLPERVAYRKLIEELLDRIVANGFLTLGDVRDAASRSNLKMPDLSGPSELVQGDMLLRTDAALARTLEGVHRKGEVYLRALQRLSSVAFGTPIGRFLTQYVALPFGGAFVLLEGLQHLVGLIVEHTTGGHVHLTSGRDILLLGLLALGSINFPTFRRQLLELFRLFGRALRALLYDLPAGVLGHPLLRRLVTSRPAVALWRLVVKPALIAAPVGLFATMLGRPASNALEASGIAFATACFVLNTRVGRTLEEIAADGVVRAWRNVLMELVPGLFRLVMAAFENVLEWVERLIYAVDEWLRFRTGQSRSVLVAKVGLGLAWGVVAYVVRIYVNLLIEPQINPIKHFPVVTVSHKIILPLSLTLTRILSAPLTPILGTVAGTFIAGTTVFLLPGVFGFLVWELSANWRLYRANRPRELRPVAFGSHGETVMRLLRPGFHSGTLPKLFARLRRAERRALWGGREKAALKGHEALHHVEESFRAFLERDFLALLKESRSLGDAEIEAGAIALATNRIRIELQTDALPGPSLWIDVEERSGLLAAHISQEGWLAELDDDARRTFEDALVGLYKMSDVELVPTGDGIGVAERPGFELNTDRRPPALGAWHRFADVVIPWSSWVETWEADGAEGVETSTNGQSGD